MSFRIYLNNHHNDKYFFTPLFFDMEPYNISEIWADSYPRIRSFFDQVRFIIKIKEWLRLIFD